MKAMSGLDIFEKMTNVNDRFIEEAAEMPNPELAVVKTSRWERFSHFMNSGLGVAMICCLVAAAVMTGIIAAGRAGGPARPPAGTQNEQPHTSPTETDPPLPTETNPPLPTKINSEEEAIEAAKLYLQDPNLNLVLPLPLEALEASAHHWQDQGEDEYWVTFRYDLCGIRTDYDIRITVTADGRFEDFREASWHENSYWLVYTEEDVEDALGRIEGGDVFYFSYRDGKLYLCSEAIVSYPSKIPGQSGCGIDHDHVFYEEEVIHTEN